MKKQKERALGRIDCGRLSSAFIRTDSSYSCYSWCVLRLREKPLLLRLTLLVVLVGVAWRLTRYLLRFPVWGDEAMLLVNYADRNYLDLAGPLENCQVAP